MNYNNNPHVKKCVRELAELLNQEADSTSTADIDRAIRLLRPSKGTIEHSGAIAATIRRAIFNKSSSSISDGQLLLNKFENQCDVVRKINPELLNPFLAVLQPLSFKAEKSAPSRQFSSLTDKKSEGAFSNTTIGVASESKSTDNYFPEEQLVVDTRVLQSDLVWVSNDVEHLLLVDLVYVLQGITGKHIKFDARSESYLVDPTLKLNSSVRDTVLCICELGWLYGRVSAYLKSSFEVATDSKGVVVQAFGFALQEELHDYYRLLAVLEQELQRTTPGKNTQMRPSDLLQFRQSSTAANRGSGNSGGDTVIEADGEVGIGGARSAAVDSLAATTEPSGLTLLRLKAWLQEPIERMCQMARMVDGALPLRGGALVSRLHAHTQHGDPSTRALVRRVLDSVCAPLYTVLSRWVLYGELQDPHKEFFVMLNGNNNVRNIWRDTYVLQQSMLPSYFSRTLAHKILLIGKSINFIRLCLQKMPRVTAKDEEIDAKRNGTSTTSPGVRKSLRGVNKGKSLGLHGQIITQGEESVFFPDDDASMAASVPDDSLMQLVPSSTRSHPAGGSVAPTPSAGALVSTPAGPAGPAGAAVAAATTAGAPKRTISMADVLGGVVTADVQSALQNLRFGGEATLQDIVYKLSASIDTKLLNLMMSRFFVQTHLLALKKFMLLGQGDFVTCLMDGVGPELKRRANQLFRHNLTGILEGALRASNAQFEPSYVLDRIGIRLLEASPGDSGWEIFSLDYSIDAPLNAVVHMDCISKYRIAFHMLWRLKRVEWSLSTTWKQHTMFNHSNRAFIPPSLRAVFHRCYLNRAMMMHVVNNLCAFLMFEVLETSWLKLQETIGRAKCIDDVISAHDAYLSEVLDKALLAPHHEDLNMQVQQLLHTVLKFCNLEEALIGDATASIARRNLGGNLVEERRKQAQRGGYTAMPAAASEGEFDGVPAYVVQRIDEAVKEYSRQFDTLMHMLKEQGEKAGEILRFLTFRLDFNDFHLQQRAYGGGVGLTSTPPAHLKSRPVNIFSAAAAGAGAGDGNSEVDRLASVTSMGSSAGAAGFRGAAGGEAQLSPTRSDSPTFGGPEAWTVDGVGGASGPAAAQPARSKPKLSSAAGSKYMR